jgi:hypothetical protein
VAEALTAHRELIAAEVLATDFGEGTGGPGADGWREHADDELGLRFWFAVTPGA